MAIQTLFAPDAARYEGVRPINIYGLRLFYLLMFVFVGFDSWSVLLTHGGAWDPMRAAAFCMFASYATLSGLGLLHPLRMLPVMIFMIMYKLLWLGVVAFPLWQAGALAGSSAEGMARIFIWVPVPMLFVPWKYVFRTFVLPAGRALGWKAG
ncbi:MAG TPA: hypothetical protein VMM79_03345 [Longimicrobiales bacterium]|nr:hypothetical protein [Longimicrobiales bacterium]